MPDRVVIDTNTLVSAALRVGSIPYQATEKALRTCDVLVLPKTWFEVEDVLLRQKFEKYQALAVRRQYLEYLNELVDTVSVHTKISECRHPKDDKFLELAIDGRADVILTGDLDLRTLHPFRGVRIVTAGEYLNETAL